VKRKYHETSTQRMQPIWQAGQKKRRNEENRSETIVKRHVTSEISTEAKLKRKLTKKRAKHINGKLAVL